MKRIAVSLFMATLSLSAGAQTNDAEALDQRGRDAIMRGEPAKAVEHLDKAVALKPSSTSPAPSSPAFRYASSLKINPNQKDAGAAMKRVS